MSLRCVCGNSRDWGAVVVTRGKASAECTVCGTIAEGKAGVLGTIRGSLTINQKPKQPKKKKS